MKHWKELKYNARRSHYFKTHPLSQNYYYSLCGLTALRTIVRTSKKARCKKCEQKMKVSKK